MRVRERKVNHLYPQQLTSGIPDPAAYGASVVTNRPANPAKTTAVTT